MMNVLRLAAFTAVLAFAGCGPRPQSAPATPPASELTDPVIPATVTGSDLPFPTGAEAPPVDQASDITSITRGEQMKSEHMAGVPPGTNLQIVRLTFRDKGEPKAQLFYFYWAAPGKWKAVAGLRETTR